MLLHKSSMPSSHRIEPFPFLYRKTRFWSDRKGCHARREYLAFLFVLKGCEGRTRRSGDPRWPFILFVSLEAGLELILRIARWRFLSRKVRV